MRTALLLILSSSLLSCELGPTQTEAGEAACPKPSAELDAGAGVDAGRHQVQAVAKWCSDGDGGLVPHLGPCPPEI
jgi:hypothetical protein